jgi:PEP-CTERM motif
MKRLILSLAALSVMAIATPVFADVIPYNNIGHIAPTTFLTASTTGNITGYFFSKGGAGDLDEIQMVDVTAGTSSGLLFPNQTTAVGTSADFGPVTAGDVLIFELVNVTLGNSVFASDPAFSADHVNHAYITAYSGGVAGIPPGTYVGTEDEPNGNSDFNYNDDSFVFTNVTTSASAVPEPSSLCMFGTGILSAATMLRRRIRRA